MDDLFYNGAALNMAGGGDFSNPLLARQGFPSHYFFVYLPLHPHAVYAWLSVFGVSTFSLLAFQNLMFFIIATATILILHHEGAPRLILWLVPLGVAAAFLKFGLRPEAFAVAVTMSGYASLLCCRKSGFLLWLSFLVLFVGTITTPRTSFFGAVLALFAFWQCFKRVPPQIAARLRFCLLPITAGLIALFIFMLCIHFRFAEFYRTFHVHSQRMNPDAITLFFRELRQFGVMRWCALFLLAFSVLGLSFIYRPGAAARLYYCLAGTFIATIVTGVFGPGTNWYLIFVVFGLASLVSVKITRCWTTCLAIAIGVVMIGVNGTKLIEEYGILTGKIQCRPPENQAAILALNSTKEHPVIVDAVTARYVYNYKLPPNALDFGFAAPFPGFIPIDTKLRPDDTFVIGPGKTGLLNGVIHTTYPIEFWSPFRIQSRAYFKNPCEAFLIPARDCVPFQEKLSTGKN